MSTPQRARKPSIWRPIKASSFVIPDGINVIKAPLHARGHESPRGAVRILTSLHLKSGLAPATQESSIGRIHAQIFDHATWGFLKRWLKKSCIMFFIMVICFILSSLLIAYAPMISSYEGSISAKITSYSSQAKRSLNSKNIKRIVSYYSLRFFRMDK